MQKLETKCNIFTYSSLGKGVSMKKIYVIVIAALLLPSLCGCTAEPQMTDPTETTAPACAHNWKNADCFYPKTCTLCNAEEGEIAGHIWDEGKCSVCSMVDAKNNPLWYGAWMHITRDRWDLFTFYPDGTCTITAYYGKPVADYDMEQCVKTAVESLQRQYGDRWEEHADRYHLVKILDYYYVVQMDTRSEDYVVEDSIITIGTIPPLKHLIIINSSVLENGEDDERYVKMDVTYISNLLRKYNEIQ